MYYIINNGKLEERQPAKKTHKNTRERKHTKNHAFSNNWRSGNLNAENYLANSLRICLKSSTPCRKIKCLPAVSLFFPSIIHISI